MLGSELDFNDYTDRLKSELGRIKVSDVRKLSDLIYTCWEKGQFVYVIGNGGSATTATHMAEDLGKSTVPDEELRDESFKRLKVLSLTDNTGWLMAIANDLDYEQVFVQQLMNYGQAGDLLIAISGSGNSRNVINAVEWAGRNGLSSFALTGFDGGALKTIADFGVHIDLADMGMVESIHLAVFHWILNDVFARINTTGRYAGE